MTLARSVRREILLLAVAALLLRAGYVWSIAAWYGLEQTSDFRFMERLAESLAAGRGFTIDGIRNFGQSIGYPAVIAMVYSAVGPRIEVALAVNVAAGVVSVVLTYLLCHRLMADLSSSPEFLPHLRAAPFVAGGLAAVHPDAWLYAGLFASENLLIPGLLLLLMVSLMSGRDWVVGTLTGAAAAAVVLVKSYALFLCPFVPLIWWCRGRRLFVRASCAALAGALCLSPWTYLNFRASSGYIVPFAAVAGEAFLDGTNPRATGKPTGVIHVDATSTTNPVELDRLKMRTALAYVQEQPLWFTRLLVLKLGWSLSPARDYLYEHDGEPRLYTVWISRWWPTAFNLMLMIGAAAGLVVTRHRRDVQVVGLSLVGAMTLLQVVFFAYPRYRYPFLFALAPFVALGWSAGILWVRRLPVDAHARRRPLRWRAAGRR